MFMDPKEIGRLVRAAREKKGLSQAQLGALIGIKQASLQSVEKGDTARSKFLPEIVRELGIPPADVGLPAETQPSNLPPVADPYGPKDFRIFSAAEGGGGEILRSPEPVDWWPRPIEVQRVTGAYGMYVVGHSMEPEFEPGQVAVVNPNLPHIAGKSYIFYAETEDGTIRATVKRLKSRSADSWVVWQHNPPPGQKNEFKLPAKLWRVAHRIVGRQDPS
ncbi:COG2932 Predicted transcriptional regulator [uncultured Caudovirales phage]|uniref:COG2932 Predicted transcriptional regulator n=1 Tax=uncultured Caudovirales phage TaxID=2100421 RepID=A0A6J5SLG4_9CAUD|nr:COG2932 Predicted transcriptional regulator [uncultured Caudovirales phage]CAB4184057.1 COG2932 Predicted transcriptional regulator [uncultured Caudovirales phage]CAB4199860.1 COG2932 Predicted transcriptional regulator [uncultured Caudovirales phage]CAB4214631.1 COG2932 Predicted transcriptional regulator [uncultured Caudovirales phage]